VLAGTPEPALVSCAMAGITSPNPRTIAGTKASILFFLLIVLISSLRFSGSKFQTIVSRDLRQTTPNSMSTIMTTTMPSREKGRYTFTPRALLLGNMDGLAERGQRLVEEPLFGLDHIGLDTYVDPDSLERI
jgi:hypothetical protein